ncbi:MAG: hypothetical protein RL685_7300, partial [Pseudomonadota bacterium]
FGCKFYRTTSGNEPVREWLKSLPAEARAEIGFGESLFEVRTSWNGNIYRVLFCFAGKTIVLVHGFQKKGQKTPKADLDLARRRMKGADSP